MIPGDTMTLGEARDWLRANVGDGARCPCCRQYAKVYRRPINAGMAASLIRMYRAAGLDYQHIPTTIGGKSREEGKLRYWDLIEEELERRDDGGRAGWWRVTPKGERWILGAITIPRYAYIYDAGLLQLAGPQTSIRTALGDRFDYEDLMGPTIQPRDTLFNIP